MRTRRRLAWVGLVLCGLILAVGVGSFWFSLGPPFGGMAIYYGVAVIDTSLPLDGVPHVYRLDMPASVRGKGLCMVFSLPRAGRATGGWSFRQAGSTRRGFYVSIPLWLPLLIVGIPTAFLWWRERRYIPPGFCQRCRYDLTGNVSGRCPECGQPAEAVE